MRWFEGFAQCEGVLVGGLTTNGFEAVAGLDMEVQV